MRPSQILAVANVAIEAPASALEDLVWLYRDVVGLELCKVVIAQCVHFSSGPLEVQFAFVPQPRVYTERRVLVVSVRDLDAAAAALVDRGWAYLPISGINRTDRRLSLLDPSGNRVEIKQEWRAGLFEAVRPVGPVA